MFNVLLRAFFLFIVVFFLIRLMGKRQVGELQPYEFVIAIMTADLATIPLSDLSLPLVWGIIGILVLSFCQLLISVLSLKSARMRKFFCGRACVLIEHGVIQERELADLRYNLNDLLEQLRTKDVFDISDVNYAILETNGELSVLLNKTSLPPTCGELEVEARPTEMGLTLISDGRTITDNLVKVQKEDKWLDKHLKSAGFSSPAEVLIAQYIPGQQLFIQGRLPNQRVCMLALKD